MTLFSVQLRAALLILLIVALRSLFLYKLPKKVFLGLWTLALLRLFIPYTGSLSLGFSIPGIEQIWLALLPVSNGTPGAQTIDTANASMVFITYSVPSFLLWIWLAGCLALAVWFIIGHLHGKRIFRFAYPAESEAVTHWMDENKIQRRVRILVCPELSSALTYGIFRPVILLPATMDLSDTERLPLILSHELEHIRHFDVLWKWTSALALCLFWYNPMVWAMHILLGRDLELHCDECVLKKLGITKKSKSEYAMALLSLAEEKSTSFSMFSHFGQSATEERILSVMHSRYAPAMFMGLALLGIVILALLSFLSFSMADSVAFTLPIQ
ncbi:M56 family metallopeptidase [Candidatus Soleaferrea massiliensis]|uniref:M56 family metallopeptidase n=1 Tax=Candidatus Soleaferrea massiliensis TaxID=1470354 RepID=UPI00058D38D1|nr:M56 family metallopeptidase [Candidatus Soleaferrea massiliensis]